MRVGFVGIREFPSWTLFQLVCWKSFIEAVVCLCCPYILLDVIRSILQLETIDMNRCNICNFTLLALSHILHIHKLYYH